MFKTLSETSNLKQVDASNLSHIMDEERKKMLTSIENNIKQHFLVEYINRYVNAVFEKELEEKTVTRNELYKLKQDLRSNTSTCEGTLLVWLNENRHRIVPEKSTDDYCVDIKVCRIYYCSCQFELIIMMYHSFIDISPKIPSLYDLY